MIGTFRAAAVAGGVVFAISNAAPGFAQKHGGILKLSHFDSPASMSILEESTRATVQPKAISALFLPDAMLLGIDGKVAQGREAIEGAYAAALKNLGGHSPSSSRTRYRLAITSLSQMTK